MGVSVSGVGVLDKAVCVLGALAGGPASLGELTSRTGIPRATAHRLVVALCVHRLAARDGVGRFVLGPAVRELAEAAVPSDRRLLAEVSRPALERLRDETGESAQIYVAAGERRVCVLSLESPHSLRTIVAVGASLPLGIGSAGRVLAAGWSGASWTESVEEREKGVASVSAPVTRGGRVVAAVSVSGPLERTGRRPGLRYGEAVLRAAAAIEAALSG